MAGPFHARGLVGSPAPDLLEQAREKITATPKPAACSAKRPTESEPSLLQAYNTNPNAELRRILLSREFGMVACISCSTYP